MNNPTDTRRSPRIPCDIPVEYHIKGDPPQEGRIVKLGTAVERGRITSEEMAIFTVADTPEEVLTAIQGARVTDRQPIP